MHENCKRVCAFYPKPKLNMHENDKRVCALKGKTLSPVLHDEPTEDQIIQDSEAVQETEKSVSAPAPYTPTQEERERHEISHWPYRAWCKFCIMGRGKNLDHSRMDAELMHDIDTISIDFMYLGQNDESAFPVMAFRVHSTRWTESFCCVSKSGRDIYNILALVHCIKRTGLRNFIFKSDQEPAILDIKTRVIEQLGDTYKIKPEASPKEEHQANGTVERCVWDIAGTARTVKCQVEHDYDVKLETDHNVLPWLIKYAGVLVTLFCVGSDGRTAYERSRGKPWKRALPKFAETIMYLPHDRNRGHRNKLEPRYLGPAIFLGVLLGTGEIFVGTKEGTVTAFAFKRLPAPERYQKEILNSFVGVPWKVRPGVPHPEDFDGNVAIEIAPADPEASATTSATKETQRGTKRPLYIRPEVELKKFGFTPGCPGCDVVKFNLGYRMKHNETCRAIIEGLVDQDEELRARGEAARKRVATGGGAGATVDPGTTTDEPMSVQPV